MESPDGISWPPPEPQSARPRRFVWRFRWVGGALIVASFFLPFFPVCRSDTISPAEISFWGVVALREASTQPATAVQEFASLCSAVGSSWAFGLGAFAFAACVAFFGLAVVRRDERSVERPARFTFWPATFLVSAVVAMIAEGGPEEYAVACAIGALLWLLFALWLRRNGRDGLPGWAVAGVGFGLGLYVYVAVREFSPPLYGFYVYALGVALLITAVLRECRAAGPSWQTVLGYHVLGLQRFKGADELCRRCGYSLRGLTAPRCPECGTACELQPVDAAPSPTSAPPSPQPQLKP